MRLYPSACRRPRIEELVNRDVLKLSIQPLLRPWWSRCAAFCARAFPKFHRNVAFARSVSGIGR
jgi:hypothetical protein